MSWSEKVRRQLRQAWKAKVLFGGFVGVLCTLMYRTLQGHPFRVAHFRAGCPGWDWLPFDPLWTWPYLSMFLLVGLAWWALPDTRAVRRFSGSLLAVAAVGWLCFLFWPTGCVRPEVAQAPLTYRWLLALDGPTNCFPCLHSAFSVLAASALARSGNAGWSERVLLGSWVAVITLSIVALRQHTDLDTLAGLGLGAVGAWFDRRSHVNA